MVVPGVLLRVKFSYMAISSLIFLIYDSYLFTDIYTFHLLPQWFSQITILIS